MSKAFEITTIGALEPRGPESIFLRGMHEQSVLEGSFDRALRNVSLRAEWLVEFYEGATSTFTNEAFSSIAWLYAAARAEARPASPQEMVTELHEKSGLTWEQIGRALGVSKRAALMWAQGGQVSALNLDNLSSLCSVVAEHSGGGPDSTRLRLVTSARGLPSPLASWVEGRVKRSSKPNAPVLRAAELMG
jgi:hypothetical protein